MKIVSGYYSWDIRYKQTSITHISLNKHQRLATFIPCIISLISVLNFVNSFIIVSFSDNRGETRLNPQRDFIFNENKEKQRSKNGYLKKILVECDLYKCIYSKRKTSTRILVKYISTDDFWRVTVKFLNFIYPLKVLLILGYYSFLKQKIPKYILCLINLRV